MAGDLLTAVVEGVALVAVPVIVWEELALLGVVIVREVLVVLEALPAH